MEAFYVSGGCVAVLVHHADPAERNTFALWLRSQANTVIRVRFPDGDERSGSIFWVRMCFGRGLLIFGVPVRIRGGDVLTIIHE